MILLRRRDWASSLTHRLLEILMYSNTLRFLCFPTVCFAQQTGSAGMEQCSMKPPPCPTDAFSLQIVNSF
jgi:hypothetical protein